MDGMLSNLVKTLENKNVFERDRKEMRTRALGILLYHFGLSLRKASTVVSCFEKTSYESVREWHQKANGIFSLEAKYREAIAIDETKVKIQGEQHIVWAAIDIQSWEVLRVWISQGRSSIEAQAFIKEALKKCKNDPKIYVDGGPWYKPALNRLGLDWEHVTFGNRNPIEQWFGILKQRIKLFYKRWPHNASVETAQQWLDSFVTMYHFTR